MKPELLTPGQSNLRDQKAFTLIEMLVVIAIIGILAGLIVGLAPIATAKMRRSRVEAERDALITYIDSYHKAKGYYPPSNTNNIIQSPLFYELTGTILTNNDKAFLSITQLLLATNTLPGNFNLDGFLNSSRDPGEVRNFCGAALKAGQYATVPLSPGPGNYNVFGVTVPGPASDMILNATDKANFNPWHYNSANPTNNQDSYDLWMDVLYSGKTNRISNWSKDPQPL